MNSLRSWFSSVRGRITMVVTALFAVVMVFGSWFLLTQAEAAWVDDIEAQDRAELEMLASDLAANDEIGDSIILPVGIDGTSFTLVDASRTRLGATPVEMLSGGVIVEGVIPEGAVPDVLHQQMIAGDDSVALLGDPADRKDDS